MSTLDRFRVKTADRKWTDPGPDLLRTHDNAVRQVKSILDDRHLGLRTRREIQKKLSEWTPPETRAEVLDRLTAWNHLGGDVFQIGTGTGDSPVKVLVAVQHERAELLATVNCSRDTSIARSLIEHQFPPIIFSGGYVYKSENGWYSDHAWGTAIDETENPDKGVHNDEVFSWIARMAASGNLVCDYVLGSQNGHVVSANTPDWDVHPSGASSSHLWHCHTSVVDHDGRKPARSGGVF